MSKARVIDHKDLAKRIRAQALRMTNRAKSSHIGGCLSAADILAVLYGGVLKVDPAKPDWSSRDRFILSKGHAAAAVYAVLAESGFFPPEWLEDFYMDGSRLPGHVTKGVPGVEVSSGSLGHGLPVGCGMALAGKRDNIGYRVFVLMSDGECDEGSNWEAILFAPHHQLDNLVAIIDYNKIQSFGATRKVLNLDPLAAKWQDFGWSVREIDGHDISEIENALLAVPFKSGKPSCLVCNTIKGKGVSFMENNLAWHYMPPSNTELQQALNELGVSD